MLLNRHTLNGIAEGTITLAFRRWLRPTVKVGTRLRTEIGELAIKAVEPIEPAVITNGAARKAGYESRDELLADLRTGAGRTLYRIKLRLAGPDRRQRLRERDKLSANDLAEIGAKLTRFDQFSRVGPWTATVLREIGRHPGLKAGDLAVEAGFDKEWLKVNIRKLKELGLTESLQPGYQLSARGEAYVIAVRK